MGVNAYAYSGTPVTREFELNNQDGYYPEGRFTDGRTPFLWYGDAYMEYNIAVGERQAIQFNVNINNVTNQPHRPANLQPAQSLNRIYGRYGYLQWI